MLIRETGELLKKGKESYYYGILFAFDFFIHLLEQIPSAIMEIQAEDKDTMFKEFNVRIWGYRATILF